VFTEDYEITLFNKLKKNYNNISLKTRKTKRTPVLCTVKEEVRRIMY
jgi:hypothetical protein